MAYDALPRLLALALTLTSASLALAQPAQMQASPSPRPADVMIHSATKLGQSANPDANPVWVTVRVPAPAKTTEAGASESTGVLLREKYPETTWRSLSPISARAIAITNHNTSLVLLLEGEQNPKSMRRWAWFSPNEGGRGESFAEGPKLPGSTEILALAGDADSLWALGFAPPTSAPPPPTTTRAAGTQPATTQSSTTPTTIPDVQSMPGPLVRPQLFRLVNGAWAAQPAAFPEALSTDPRHISMAVINELPTVAVQTAPDLIRLYRISKESSQWEPYRKANGEGASKLSIVDKERAQRIVEFKLLNAADNPAVWMWFDTDNTDKSPVLGRVWSPEQKTSPELPSPNVLLTPADVDFTVFGNLLWAVYRSPADRKIYLQRYRFDTGQMDGPKTELTWATPRQNTVDWVFMGLMALVTVAILATLLRKRAASREERADPDD